MVLRGQPVGEQGAADRWTALDPHLAGSGAGDPRGAPFFLHVVQPRALRGPFSMPRGPLPGVAPVLLHSLLIGKKKGPFRTSVIVAA